MKVIAISRQVGSFGDEIAARVAQKVGLEFVGREKVHQLAQSCDPEYSDACSLYESEHGPRFFERLFFDRPTYTSLFEALTYELAAKGDVVIVGRGSQIVLRDIPGVLRVRAVAPTNVRVERIQARYGISKEAARDYVSKYDSEMRSLVQAVFQVDPRDWSFYDLVLNTVKFTAAGATDVVASAFESMERAPDPENLRERLINMAMAKRIETLVRKKLTAAVARHVQVSVTSDGMARVSGFVAEKRDKARAEDIVSAYPGVKQVVNELKVTQLTF